jgi:DNA-binding transcriptional regulator of glucitol operon
MIIIRNERLIKRNGRIGQWMSLGALAVLAVAIYLSVKYPDLFLYSIVAMVVGFLMTQVGLSFSNRWGRSPRPDEQLDAALKGLPADTTIYHYVAAAPHLLVGPMGLWILLPYHQRGRIRFEKNRWRLSGGGFMQSYMRIFGQEGIGRPDLEAAYQVESLTKQLSQAMGDGTAPQVNAALVFSSQDIEIDGGESPLPALPIKKVKDFMRQKMRESTAPALLIRQVKEALPQA